MSLSKFIQRLSGSFHQPWWQSPCICPGAASRHRCALACTCNRYSFDRLAAFAVSATCLQEVLACSALPLVSFQDSQRSSLLSWNGLLKCLLTWSNLSLLTQPGLQQRQPLCKMLSRDWELPLQNYVNFRQAMLPCKRHLSFCSGMRRQPAASRRSGTRLVCWYIIQALK